MTVSSSGCARRGRSSGSTTGPSTTSLAVDVPTLIVQGGITPTGHVDWGRQLASRTVTHATVVTFPTLGHNAMTRDQPPCLDEIRQSFIAQPDAPIDAAACEAASPAIAFVDR